MKKRVLITALSLILYCTLTSCSFNAHVEDYDDLEVDNKEDIAIDQAEEFASQEDNESEENDYPENSEDEMITLTYTVKILENVWESANMENSRFQTSEEFINQVDYYISAISEFVLIENWYEQYPDIPSIEISLQNSFSITTVRRNRIYINLNKLAFEHDLAPIAHEIAHVIVKSSLYRTESLDEGLASYLHERFGDNPTVHTWGIDAHVLANMFFSYYEEEYNTVFSVIGTRDRRQEEYMLGEQFLRQIFYVLSHSFAKYLIDTYGIEDFMKLHDATNSLIDEYYVLYGKSFDEIKSEWHSVILSSPSMSLEEYDSHLEELFDKHNWQWGS